MPGSRSPTQNAPAPQVEADRRLTQLPFQQRFLAGTQTFPGAVLLLLSSQDLTAQEFLDGVLAFPQGAEWLRQGRAQRIDVAGADHTFSRPAWRRAAEEAVVTWLAQLPPPGLAILMVCMGNICRSPTAAAVVGHHLRQAGLAERIRVDSAGTLGQHAGQAPDPRACKVARQRGYDMSTLRARGIRNEDFSDFDLILAMDRDNLDHLRRRCPPAHQHKLRLFLDHAGGALSGEVPDPYYGNEAGFERVLDLIESGSQGLVSQLQLDVSSIGKEA